MIFVTRIVLDWEAAYAEDYRLEGRLDPPPPDDVDDGDGGWCTLYDGGDRPPRDDVGKNDAAVDKSGDIVRRKTEEFGQSPGVKRKMPLHVVHTIDWEAAKEDEVDDAASERSGIVVDNDGSCRKLRYLRVYIRRPARGWGVSLWQVDVHGAVLD
jgi:hypothetical protein